MATPVPVYDKKGRQILLGDLLRSLHFIDPRRRRHYLYHVACACSRAPSGLRGVPVKELEPSMRRDGGTFWLTEESSRWVEIIAGLGPNGDAPHDRRPRTDASARASGCAA